MRNLFSIFDPKVLWLNFRINWEISFLVVNLIPVTFWISKSKFMMRFKIIIFSLNREFKINFGILNTPGHAHWAIRLFLIILLNNVLGLTPYTFTSTSHLSFAITLALLRWVGYTVIRFCLRLEGVLAHLLPLGTPYVLIPFIVLIELVRRLIRPLTLSVRLVANLVAGHLLLTLVSSPFAHRSFRVCLLLRIGLIRLMVLESAVAFIQAYVFSILRTLYLNEVNFPKLNYLCNFNKLSP